MNIYKELAEIARMNKVSFCKTDPGMLGSAQQLSERIATFKEFFYNRCREIEVALCELEDLALQCRREAALAHERREKT